MLGKYGRRFITTPNSLVNKLFKARYFSTCTFFEANVGDNPNFIWRSICESREVIKASMMWMVGSGETIDILGQPWLLDDRNQYISSITQGPVDNKVSSIMTVDHRAWDEYILTDMFNSRDQQCVKSI